MKLILTKYIERFRKSYLLVLALIGTIACDEFVEIDLPETEIVAESVFQSDGTATSAMLHLYTEIHNTSSFAGGGQNSVTFLQGLTADELIPVSNTSEFFFLNNVLPITPEVSTTWNNCYNIIYGANAIIEGLLGSSGVSQEVSAQLEGEARFIRAFSHFYLVNLFGDVPYISTTDYRVNATASRMVSSEVYQNIVDDLLVAKALLNDDYPSSGRVRPNKGVITAFLARVYAYTGDWANAEIQATEVINNTAQYGLTDLNSVFLIDSYEAIWQLFPVETNNNGNEGSTFIVVDAPRFVVLNEDLFNAFEEGDARKTSWVGSVTGGSDTYIFPYKYKSLDDDPESEYSIVLRLAEQYLIRAEARAQQNKLSEAISDLDVIRHRAELPLMVDTNPAINQSSLLLAIEQERRVELFTEWGHRWFDLKRTGRTDAVLSAVKTGWESTDALLPLPQNELDINQNLTQNPGY
ncbi:RagB/SusD family nutrient uptake outer membrane protein [Fulvivirgaceae bacterium BMA12]|uniref:RagB/SusD family nutrient uptake outer membrane protein n=1 Tax=Agaribacillus aureus TaxID=3051825 RepID=A0ABT8L6V6_9BACT|nr:RagB/SusD family nutrient uptake outer membrane protein [Fulvivirgaceae bacterium BMA12]